MSKITAWKTTKDELNCSKVNDFKIVPEVEKLYNAKIKIDSSKEYQEILGFGGAFNEVGFEAIASLNTEGKDELFKALFDEEECNFSLCRTPIGASDFALDAYSLNDTKDDYEMKNFSIERDKKYLLPYIKEALKYRPDAKIWSCPWSPPYWMKTNGDMCNGGELIETPENLKAYAKYLVKYLQAYKNEGVDIYGLCIQNETDVANVYPTSTMTSELMTKFIRAYYMPEIIAVGKKRPPETEVWAGTIRDVMNYADGIVNDMVNRQFITGVGYQYSVKEVVADGYAKFKNLKLIHTEAPCHNGANSWEEAKEIFEDILMYLQNGCVNYCYWNMVLNETGFSTWNWRQNTLITVDRENKKVIYNPEFYIMKHFSKFVKLGAKRLESLGDYAGDYIAFKNPDESITVILNNFSAEAKKVEVSLQGKDSFIAELEADSIYTLTIEE
jgi:glucosylceramidase